MRKMGLSRFALGYLALYTLASCVDSGELPANYVPAGVGADVDASASNPVPGADEDITTTPQPPTSALCIPGTTQACLCFDGASGVQVCNTLGSGFDACVCAPARAPDADTEPRDADNEPRDEDSDAVEPSDAESDPGPSPEADVNEADTEDVAPCAPACEGKDCGDDGCGGACGLCSADASCVNGLCEATSGGMGSPCETFADCDEVSDAGCLLGFCAPKCQVEGEVIEGACDDDAAPDSWMGDVWGCPSDLIYCIPGAVDNTAALCQSDTDCAGLGDDFVCAGALLISANFLGGVCVPAGARAGEGAGCTSGSECASLLCLDAYPGTSEGPSCVAHCQAQGHCQDGQLCEGYAMDNGAGEEAWLGICVSHEGSLAYCGVDECPVGESCHEFTDPTNLQTLGWCVACSPDCEGKACGGDGCGGSCGACGPGESCQAQQCVADESCQAGSCVAEALVGEDGGCVWIFKPEGSSCDNDEDVCTYESCDGQGACISDGFTETCQSESAENPCWTYVCKSKSGCVQTSFVDGASCDDNNPCTYNDTCTVNQFDWETCQGAPIPIDDQNPCTDDACVEGEITHTPIEGAVCDPESPCSETGTCSDAVCQPTTPCECLQDSDCEQPESLCQGVMVCDTSGEVPACLIDPASVVVCDAPTKACHTNTCNALTGGCEELAIVDGTACSDDNACTTDDACLAGACVGGPAPACDDGVFCNGVETCDAALGCQPGPAPDVSDGVDCTIDSCSAETDAPVHTPNDTLCDNSLFCDGVEVCAGADGCQPGDPPDLNDGVGCTVDACDEEADQVTHSPDDAACDNALFCDGAETCSADDDCQPGEAPALDDSVACTVDTCDEDQDLVLHTPDPALCDDENACTLESCDPTAGCGHSPTDAPCSDDDPCTGQDACVEGTCVGTPILKEGAVCNNVDDDCDGVTDEDCSFGIGGHVMGGGFVTATSPEGAVMDGSSGTRRFVGETKNDVFTLRSGLPPRGEED